jgi:hypothetical protein
MDEITKGYIAGFFDGEGSVTLGFASKKRVTKKKGIIRDYSPSIQVVFSNSNLDILLYLQKSLGKGCICNEIRKGFCSHWAPHRTLRIFKLVDIIEVSEILLTKCILKREQLLICKDAAKGLLNRKVEHHKWSPESIVFFNEQIAKMSVIKDSSRLGRPRIHDRPEIYSAVIKNKRLS